jgi:hypothetical protein
MDTKFEIPKAEFCYTISISISSHSTTRVRGSDDDDEEEEEATEIFFRLYILLLGKCWRIQKRGGMRRV